MPAMRSSGVMRVLLLVRLGFSHDLLGGEADLAARERVPDEEVVGQRRIEVRALLDVGKLDDRRGQRDRLRDLVAVERGDRRLDRHGDLGGPGSRRRAMQPAGRVLAAQLAESVLGLAGDWDHRMLGIEQGTHGAGRAALYIDAVELLVDRDRIGGGLLRGAVAPLAHDLDDLELLSRPVQDLAKPDMAIAVDRVPRRAADLEQLAAIALDLLE